VAKPTVILIGGPPGAGKTTLGRALAAKFDATSLTADDLLTAVKAVTTPHSHPGLHVMTTVNPVEYFTTTSVEQLIVDAGTQHEAAWPAIKAVIGKHASWGPSIVIDGWFFQPKYVAKLGLEGVMSFWLVVAPTVLEERERRNMEFFGQSANPEQMIRNFLGRSLCHNELVRQQAMEFGLSILNQDGSASVDDLCALAMARIEETANKGMQPTAQKTRRG